MIEIIPKSVMNNSPINHKCYEIRINWQAMNITLELTGLRLRTTNVVRIKDMQDCQLESDYCHRSVPIAISNQREPSNRSNIIPHPFLQILVIINDAHYDIPPIRHPKCPFLPEYPGPILSKDYQSVTVG